MRLKMISRIMLVKMGVICRGWGPSEYHPARSAQFLISLKSWIQYCSVCKVLVFKTFVCSLSVSCFFLENILPHKAGQHPSETFFLCYSCYAFAAVVLLPCLCISCEIHPIFSSCAVLKLLSHHAPISVNMTVIYVSQLLYLLVL